MAHAQTTRAGTTAIGINLAATKQRDRLCGFERQRSVIVFEQYDAFGSGLTADGSERLLRLDDFVIVHKQLTYLYGQAHLAGLLKNR